VYLLLTKPALGSDAWVTHLVSMSTLHTLPLLSLPLLPAAAITHQWAQAVYPSDRVPCDSSFTRWRILPLAHQLYCILRLGVIGCFIGHGAYGLLTKEAWVPYFVVWSALTGHGPTG
jgi:hypothetical protein